MRIIRLQIERRTKSHGLELLRQAVSLDLKRHSKIKEFISYVKKICKLDDLKYQLVIDGFSISHNDRAKLLQEQIIYRLRIKSQKFKEFQRIDEPSYLQTNKRRKNSEQDSSDDSEQEIEKSHKKKESKDRIQSKNLVKQKKILKKQKIQSSSSSSDSSSDSSSVSEDQSQSSQQYLAEPEAKKRRKMNENVQINSQSVKNPLKNSDQKINKLMPVKQQIKTVPKENIKQKVNQIKKPLAQNLVLELNSQSQQSQQSDSQSDSLPQLGNAKKIIEQKKPQIQPAVQYTIHIPQKDTNVQKAPAKYISKQKNMKKAIISDSSQSDPSPPKDIKPKVVSSQPALKKPISQAQNIKPANSLKIPPALRNQMTVKKTFQKHKQNQWLSVDKIKMSRWQQKGNTLICQPNNKIRFKIMELDEQKFIPVKSTWISGEVIEAESDGKIILKNIDQEGKQFKQKDQFFEHNMDELQLYKLFATKQQQQCFGDEQIPVDLNSKNQQNKGNIIQENANDKNSLQKYICGQVNYYFSDKSYSVDLYTQMHANRHPQKYMNISFLLNFPKIKKVIRDQEKLFQYLKQDQKYEQRNFEVDFEQRLIRKRQPKQDKKQEIQLVSSNHINENSVNEQNQEASK